MTIITDIEQGTEEWRQLRLGKVTASRIADVTARTKTGWGASRANYLTELVLERVTGRATEKFVSDAMRFGTEMEAEARAAYSFFADADVQQIAFAHHPTIAMSGASPDGLVGEDGLCEIKVPQPPAHLDTLLSETIPERYITQMMWQMATTGRRWCDFVSYNPAFPDSCRLFIKRVHRDDVVIAGLEDAVRQFLAEVDARLEQLSQIIQRRAAA